MRGLRRDVVVHRVPGRFAREAAKAFRNAPGPPRNEQRADKGRTVRYPLGSRPEPSQRIAFGFAAAAFALHLAFANRYDVFRDELYFIVCGRHPALGYVDQPPVVPLLAAATYGLGHQTWLLRMPAVLAAAALVLVTCAFVRLLGGGRGATVMAGAAVAFAPMFLGLTATLNTSSFEPLCWTLVAYLIARRIVLDERSAMLWCGAAIGITLEIKDSIPFWLVALAIGVLATDARRILATRETALGALIALALVLPNAVWQTTHGWTIVELLVNGAHGKNVVLGPLAFIGNQILVMNPLFAPIWIAGVIGPYTVRALRPARALAIAFVAIFVILIALHGKDYYLAAAFPTAFAIGAVALEHAIGNVALRTAWIALGIALSGIAAPMALPILDPPALLAYERTMHLTPQAAERVGEGVPLPQTFADMLGWHDYVRQVGTAWLQIPARARAHTSVLVDNYGEAAALDVYGSQYALPPALSGHNQYYLWGLRGQPATDILRVQNNLDHLRPYCTEMRPLGTTSSPYAMPYENGKGIAYCRGVHPPLAKLWPKLKAFE
jgi:hypothetical protein